MAYLTSGLLGVDLTDTPTTQEWVLGTTAPGTDNSEWVYVQASGAITQYDWVAIDENFQAAAGTKALADAGHQVGFAQVAFADNDYGWIATKGTNISVRAAASCAADTILYTSGTAGVLDDASTSQTEIKGVTAVTAASAGGITNVEVIATYPHPDLT